MTIKIVPLLLLLCNVALSQEVKIIKTGEGKISGQSAVNYYSVSIYNNTDKPICVPVSNYFSYRMNTNDTLELGGVYSEKDSIIVVSLFWSKKDLEIDPQQMPGYPVVINPRTYLLTNILFHRSSNIKGAYFEFKYSFGPNLDYQKISSSYNAEPKFRWMKTLKFIEDRLSIQL
ncbi:hypothetical protein [Flavisolibacter ginsenosidimutans]|uniref:DUF2393 domain-containing protein n=1 Tax=Flavisolibacter ginsenosidimutans TaxID=661481 RepID=A0A5B8ULP9_9BACT|nr:hypothetical protein [Flavisolibacter ginsenosidimutans]QEC57604.1 hypothetical protein FSB75_17395 [Flavisolibacter ginsenosidimutans]